MMTMIIILITILDFKEQEEGDLKCSRNQWKALWSKQGHPWGDPSASF